MTQINVKIQVIKGPELGKTYNFSGGGIAGIGGNGCPFVVGREGEGSDADFKLNDDRSVSRNHCIIEIFPPKCYIRDYPSRHGTKIKKRNKKLFENINSQFVELSDGDFVEIGSTILKINIIENNKVFEDNKSTTVEKIEVNLLKRIVNWINRIKNIEQNQRPIKPIRSIINGNNYFCINDSVDVSNYANNDGRALQFSDSALYLCPGCISKISKKCEDIGNYKILEELGKGGMGIVHKAWHKSTCRIVALKRIKNEFSNDEHSIKSFNREMDIHQKLDHKNIVQLLDGIYDERSRRYYFISEFMPDGDIEGRMINEYHGPLPVYEACDIITQVLKGLEYMHGCGSNLDNSGIEYFSRQEIDMVKKSFIHRDIKPSNIFISYNKKGCDSITAKIGDFGISKSEGEQGSLSFSRYGEGKGTLVYMPVEQMKNSRDVKQSVDIYAVGITMYYLLTTKYPVDIASPFENNKQQHDYATYLRMILTDERIPILEKNSKIRPDLAKIIDDTIRKDEKNRKYKTAKELREAIENCKPI